jgi:hypothetical protein
MWPWGSGIAAKENSDAIPFLAGLNGLIELDNGDTTSSRLSFRE